MWHLRVTRMLTHVSQLKYLVEFIFDSVVMFLTNNSFPLLGLKVTQSSINSLTQAHLHSSSSQLRQH